MRRITKQIIVFKYILFCCQLLYKPFDMSFVYFYELFVPQAQMSLGNPMNIFGQEGAFFMSLIDNFLNQLQI